MCQKVAKRIVGMKCHFKLTVLLESIGAMNILLEYADQFCNP